MQSIENNNNMYYSANTEYDMVMSKYQFHDSGIADEVLSDEDESNHQENQLDDHDRPKKPSQSYLEIIAEAILKAPNRMMQLYEIYSYFQRKYRYFAEDVNKSWKNSVRHNLSLNDCFVKAGRGTNGKGHYWRIHDLAEKEFEQGRFRRRRYRQQMQQLQMQNSAMHQSTYGHPSFYPPANNPYYMCSSSSPPPYHSLYSSPNTSVEIPPINSPMLQTTNAPSPISTPYPSYDPYCLSYYPGYYDSMASSYTSSNQSMNFDG